MEIVHDFSPDGDPDPARGRSTSSNFNSRSCSRRSVTTYPTR